MCITTVASSTMQCQVALQCKLAAERLGCSYQLHRIVDEPILAQALEVCGTVRKCIGDPGKRKTGIVDHLCVLFNHSTSCSSKTITRLHTVLHSNRLTPELAVITDMGGHVRCRTEY